jgi:threonine synthase
MSAQTLMRLECMRCGAPADLDSFHAGCPECAAAGQSVNLTTVYDLERARPSFEPEALTSRPTGMWRYEALLPFAADEAVSLGEGGTPLVAAPRLSQRIGAGRLWIKDESRNPTWSFKDRSSAMAASHAKQLHSRALVVSSTGNAAASISAYARRAGLPAIVFFAKGVDVIMSAFVRSYAPYLVSTPTKPERWELMRHCVQAWDFYPVGNYRNPPVGSNPFMIDGYKTIAFETWEQLGRRSPDWVFGPTGYTNCLYGVFKGFQELKGMGLSGSPRLGAGEVYGSLSRALREGADSVQPADVDFQTLAISIGTAQNTSQGLLAIRQSQGLARQVSEREILNAQRLLVEEEGIFGETASAAGLAALIRSIEEGVMRPEDEIVLILTSTGLKTLAATGSMEERVPLATDVEELIQVLERDYEFRPNSSRDPVR